MSDKFPWELLKAECLRLVCAQLVEASTTSEGQNSFKPGRKEDMVAFLHDVHERGVIKALEDVAPPRKTIVVSTTPQAATTPSKRKNVPVDDDDDGDGDEDMEDDSDNKNGEEGYNTRYKGVKRVKVHGERPEPQPKRRVGRPRKSASEGGVVVGGARGRGRPRKEVSTSVVGGEHIKVSSSKGKGKSLENGDGVAGEVIPSISRPRGRPKKNATGVPGPAKKPLQNASANAAPKSKDSGREVFDGIVLVKRNKDQKENGVGDDGEGLNDEGGDGFEEAAVIAAVNGDAQGDLSSLGGSNKENEHEISATYTPDPEEGHDIDADGEFEADAEVLL